MNAIKLIVIILFYLLTGLCGWKMGEEHTKNQIQNTYDYNYELHTFAKGPIKARAFIRDKHSRTSAILATNFIVDTTSTDTLYARDFYIVKNINYENTSRR